MTFWQWVGENKTKLIGILSTVVATTLSMLALGMFNADASSEALLSPYTQRWLTVVLSLINAVLGAGTIAVGVSNTTKERVAEARVEVASAMRSAIEATPGTTIVPPRG